MKINKEIERPTLKIRKGWKIRGMVSPGTQDPYTYRDTRPMKMFLKQTSDKNKCI